MKHLLVISQYFSPEPFRINDLCAEWIRRGYRVTVLTGIPNYPQGKFYPGYGWFRRRRETIDGVDVIRLPITARGKNPLSLALNYVSFVICGWFWKTFTHIKADLVFIFEVSPMTQALPGVAYARKQRIPCHIYVQDLWPENVEIVAGVHNRTILSALGRMTDRIYAGCTKIYTTSQSFVQAIAARGVPEDKLVYLPQYAEEEYHPLPRVPAPEIPSDDRINIIFTGNIGSAQGLDILPRAAGLLRENGDRVRFVIVGDGRNRSQLEAQIAEAGVSEFFCLIGRKPSAEIPRLLAACEAAFLSFMPSELFAMTVPAKLQSYLACAMPVLAAANGETEQIITDADCGLVSALGDEVALCENIRRFCALSPEQRRELGKNALAYSRAHFDKSVLLDKLDSYFK